MWTMLMSLWLTLSGTAPRKTSRCRRPAFQRPRLEALEDRSLPSVSSAWSAAIGYGGPFASAPVATDTCGNVYTAGTFSGQLVPSGSSTPLTSAGGTDIFVAKYSQGGTFQWAVSLGGANNDSADGIAVDSAAGKVYVVGSENGVAVAAQLNTTGTVNWTKNLAANNASAVAVDGSGYAYVTSGSGLKSYVTKLDASGNQQWVDTLISQYLVTTPTIATAGSNVYVGGRFISSATVTTAFGTTTLTGNKFTAGYVLDLASNGKFVWSHNFLPVSKGASANGDINSISIAADAAGNVYATGNFYGTVNFSGGTQSSGSFVLNGTFYGQEGAIYLTKLAPTNGSNLWAEQLATPLSGSIQDDYVLGIAVDTAGAVYLTGVFSGTLNFNPAGASNLTDSSNKSDSNFLVKLGTNGTFQGAVQGYGGSAVAVDSLGDIDLSGFDFLWQLPSSAV